MATMSERLRAASPVAAHHHADQDVEIPVRVFLQPIASPSVLGYFGLGSALIVYGTWITGSWGTAASPKEFFQFILLFGGVGQLVAAVMGWRARDAVAASIHGAWGAFFLGFGIMYLLDAAGTIAVPGVGKPFAPLGFWFAYMAVITWTTAFAALASGFVAFFTQAVLGSAATIAAAGTIVGSAGWQAIAGWLFVATAGLGFYIGAALMLDNWFGYTILPLLKWQREANVIGGRPVRPVEVKGGDPGVKVGQ